VLERSASIDQTSIEEDPASIDFSPRCSRRAIGERYLDRTPGKSNRIDPRQRSPTAIEFLGYDTPPGLVDRNETSQSKFCQQSRLAAAGAA
jgi:hypothetical protein